MDEVFERPNLTSNGTMGGDSFACTASTTGYGQIYYALDGSSSTQWQSAGNYSNTPQWLTFYNPEPLKVTKIVCTTPPNTSAEGWSYSWQLKNATLQGSNDNSSWVDISSVSNVGKVPTATIEADSNNSYYKYHRIYVSETNAYQPNVAYYAWACSDIAITATYEVNE